MSGIYRDLFSAEVNEWCQENLDHTACTYWAQWDDEDGNGHGRIEFAFGSDLDIARFKLRYI